MTISQFLEDKNVQIEGNFLLDYISQISHSHQPRKVLQKTKQVPVSTKPQPTKPLLVGSVIQIPDEVTKSSVGHFYERLVTKTKDDVNNILDFTKAHSKMSMKK